MQVLLLEDIQKIGRVGDIIEVSEGYARNFLFPQGKAALATQQVKKIKETKDSATKKRIEEELASQQELASKLENTELVVTGKLKAGDVLYGSVKAKEVADLLSSQSGVRITHQHITGAFPLKRLGLYPITVQLGQGVEFQMSVSVVPYE